MGLKDWVGTSQAMVVYVGRYESQKFEQEAWCLGIASSSLPGVQGPQRRRIKEAWEYRGRLKHSRIYSLTHMVIDEYFPNSFAESPISPVSPKELCCMPRLKSRPWKYLWIDTDSKQSALVCCLPLPNLNSQSPQHSFQILSISI